MTGVAGWLLDPFGDALARRALAEVLVLSLACGPLGVWIVLHRRSYAAESLAHAMLPGLVVAALTGLPLLLGAAGGVLAGAVGIGLAGRDTLFGAGALLALSPAVPPRLAELLFGDLLGISARDLAEAGALVAVTAVALALGHRRLAVAAFDPVAARSLGVRPGRWDLVLLVLLAVATVATVRGLGNLLAVALLLAPGATALNLTRRLGPALAAAVGLAALAGAGGLVLSYHARLAAGASVALCAVALFALSLAVSPRAAGA